MKRVKRRWWKTRQIEREREPEKMVYWMGLVNHSGCIWVCMKMKLNFYHDCKRFTLLFFGGCAHAHTHTFICTINWRRFIVDMGYISWECVMVHPQTHTHVMRATKTNASATTFHFWLSSMRMHSIYGNSIGIPHQLHNRRLNMPRWERKLKMK